MLGNSRFLIIVISVLSAVALILVGASASDLTREEIESVVRESESLRHVAQDAYPVSLFKTTYRYFTNSNNQPSQMSSATEDNPLMVHYVYLKDISNTVIVFNSDDDVPFWIGSLSGGAGSLFDVHIGDTVYQLHNQQFQGDLISYSQFSHNFGTYWTKQTLSPRFEVLPFFASILGVGTSLLSFVMSNWVVLVPVVAFVCILGFGVIRRLFKGV